MIKWREERMLKWREERWSRGVYDSTDGHWAIWGFRNRFDLYASAWNVDVSIDRLPRLWQAKQLAALLAKNNPQAWEC